MSYTLRDCRISTPEDIIKFHLIFMKAIDKDTGLNGFKRGCETGCGECETCKDSKTRIAQLLTHPNSWAWEVWNDNPVDLVGILTLSKVDPGRDATAAYTFFDGKLRDKTEVLQRWFDWAFDAFDLRRLTLEVPSYAFAALRHAKKLGFGGPFRFEGFPIEGIKTAALPYRDKQADLILMGMTEHASNA